MLFINPKIQIPLKEIEFSFAHSSGPGGQNVNKVESKVVLRWSVTTSPNLPEAVRTRFLAKYRSRLNLDGELIITSQRYRHRLRNVADCLEKLKAMIASVATAPTARRPTRPTLASRKLRARSKLELSQKKKTRRPPPIDE